MDPGIRLGDEKKKEVPKRKKGDGMRNPCCRRGNKNPGCGRGLVQEKK